MSELRVADMSQDTLDSIKKFKFRKCNNTIALTLKIDKETLKVEIEDTFEEDTTLESLKDALPSHQPRYVLLSYRFEKHDGRVSFPYCLLFSTPQGSPPNLQMMYAASLTNVTHKSEVTKVFELRDLDELSDEWLEENLNRTA